MEIQNALCYPVPLRDKHPLKTAKDQISCEHTLGFRDLKYLDHMAWGVLMMMETLSQMLLLTKP